MIRDDASVDNAGTEKASLTRSMASRCISGEFGGIAYRAGQDPECLRLGVTAMAIQYHIDRMEPAAAAARAAERARVATETSAAEAAHVPVKIVFVERGWSAPAAAAVEAQSA